MCKISILRPSDENSERLEELPRAREKSEQSVSRVRRWTFHIAKARISGVGTGAIERSFLWRDGYFGTTHKGNHVHLDLCIHMI